MKKIQFKIEGITCNSCSELINEICEESNAKIIFNNNLATLEFDENKTDLSFLIKEIERENFTISDIKTK